MVSRLSFWMMLKRSYSRRAPMLPKRACTPAPQANSVPLSLIRKPGTALEKGTLPFSR
jgi:hypothetical protein